MARKQTTLADQLRSAIKASEMTPNAIAVKAGISPASMSRFMRGERSMTIDAADKVARVVGLEFRAKE